MKMLFLAKIKSNASLDIKKILIGNKAVLEDQI